MLLAAPPTRTDLPMLLAERPQEKRNFISHDGTAIFYRCWPARSSRPAGGIVLLHRENEHSGRIAHLVDELGLADFAFFAWDARGHGCSPGARGDAEGMGTLGKDLDAFVRHIARRHGLAMPRLHLVAQGASSVVAAAWVADYAARIGSLVLAAPAFECRGLASLAPGALHSLAARRGTTALRTYARPEELTQDLGRRESYRNDPLIGATTSARLLGSLRETARRVTAGASAIRIPVQLLIAGDDRLVRRRPQLAFYNALGSPDKEFHTFDGFCHDILGERDRRRALDQVGTFVRRHAAIRGIEAPTRAAATLRAVGAPVTGLADPLDRLRSAASRTTLRAIGRASAGIGLAMRSGLDSPPVVDHVRRNVPTGSGCLGRLLDRHFLSSLPARTLRMRAANLEQAIRAASVRLRTTGLPVRILDLAAGDGCQVGEAVRRPAPAPHAAPISGSGGDSVTRTQGVAQGHDGTRSACVPAPQSDEHATASPASCATLAIARLHDLVQQPPHAVQSMLTEFARAVPPGGCLILTAGPHQPGWQRHAVALGTPAQGDLPPPGAAWCLADLDRLVASAGFELHDRWVDDWGVFSVSLCVRAGAEAMMRGLVAR